METTEFLPELPQKGSPRYEFTRAYYARNKKIAEYCDVLIAFVDASRKGGTENTIGYAEKTGKKIIIQCQNPPQSQEHHPQNSLFPQE